MVFMSYYCFGLGSYYFLDPPDQLSGQVSDWESVIGRRTHMSKVKEIVKSIINLFKNSKVTVTFKTPIIDLSLTPATRRASLTTVLLSIAALYIFEAIHLILVRWVVAFVLVFTFVAFVDSRREKQSWQL